MKVVEIFNSIDGEGKRAGELTTFIRLFGCNLKCSYCDSQYACVETPETKYTEMGIDDIIEECSTYPTKNITVTGGEPLLHKDIDYLLYALSRDGYDVNVETNGSMNIGVYYRNATTVSLTKPGVEFPKETMREYENVWFTVDYKSPSSKMEKEMCMDNFDNNYANVIYKFVVGSKLDLDKAYEIITKHIFNRSEVKNVQIYLSPIFNKIEPKEIVEYMQKNSMYSEKIPIKVQLQLHKFIWSPDTLGV